MDINTYPASPRIFIAVRPLAVGGFGGLIARWQLGGDRPLIMGRYVTQKCRTQRGAQKQARKALRAWSAASS